MSNHNTKREWDQIEMAIKLIKNAREHLKNDEAVRWHGVHTALEVTEEALKRHIGLLIAIADKPFTGGDQ